MKYSILLLPLLAALAIGSPISIQNASFESAVLPLNAGNGPFSQLIIGSPFGVGGTLDSWAAASTTTNAQVGGFAPTLGGNNWTAHWWDGNNIGYVILFGAGTASLSQVLSTALDSGTDYKLTVDVGRRRFTSNFNYAIQLFAGTTEIASASNLNLASDSSGTDSALYASPSGNPLAGQALKIVLTATSTSALTEAFFDSVRLDAVHHESPVPEPGTLVMLCCAGFAAAAARLNRPSEPRE